ncbi:MAG: amidophosphoribosyltransferase [Candidatus Aenigmatarchaeota archaeon]
MGCGVAGCVGENASFFVYHSLLQLQHRGEDTTKILSFDDRHYEYGGVGQVSHVYSKEALSSLKGNYAIGQVRYPTVGKYDDPKEKLRDAPPLWTDSPCFLALAHNGDMPKESYNVLRKKLESEGFYFKTNSDLEITEKILAKGLRKNIKNNLENEDIFNAIEYTMRRVPAAYSITGIVSKEGETKLIGFCDPQKVRPLVFGKSSNLQIIASESPAVDVLSNVLNENFETFEIKGGEAIILEEGKEPEKKRLIEVQPKHCSFEYTYFARPDSIENEISIYNVRFNLGQIHGKRNKFKADAVLPIPNSGRIYDKGFSSTSGIPSVEAYYKNPYIGRAFIRPPSIREEVSRVKSNPIKHLISGKDIIITEDSIVRGLNSKNNNDSLRKFGAKKIYGIIATPPLVEVCEWGIDMKDPNAFAARGKSEEEIAKLCGYDGLSYSTIDELVEAIGLPKDHLCLKCIGGDGPEKGFDKYIIPINDPNF